MQRYSRQHLKQRLTNFLEHKQVWTKSQFGFIKNSSTDDASLDLYGSFVRILNASTKCLAIYLDLAKAVDTYDKLIFKINNYGMRALVFDIFKDYLTN